MRIDADLLAHLPDDLELQVTVRAGDLRRALTRANGGPEMVSTVWCAENLGFSSRKWRDWCEAALIAGAVKDEGGWWRLPNRAAREHLARVLAEEPGSQGGKVTSTTSPPRRRGPWKKKARG
jgi:hypothetical protein